MQDKKWLKAYEAKKEILKSPFNYAEFFKMKKINGYQLHILPMGEVHFPTGEILVRDPLVYLSKDEKPYTKKVATGKFPLETLVVELEEDHYRYALTRVKISDNEAVYYENALTGEEDLDEFEEGDISGFDVDAGLATIVDVKTRDLFADFVQNWEKQNNAVITHEDGAMEVVKNIYDDFFATEFAKNYEQNPDFQREGGDWINFQIPNADVSVPMFQSGHGDGFYPVYFGIDAKGDVCEIIIEFIDITNDEDEDEDDDE